MSKIYNQMMGMIEQKGVLVPLKIVLAADASVSSFVGKGVASVTKSDTGEYTVVLKDNYNKMLSCPVGPQGGINDVTPYVKSEDVANKSIVIGTHNGTADTDTAVAHTINVLICATKSSVV